MSQIKKEKRKKERNHPSSPCLTGPFFINQVGLVLGFLILFTFLSILVPPAHCCKNTYPENTKNVVK